MVLYGMHYKVVPSITTLIPLVNPQIYVSAFLSIPTTTRGSSNSGCSLSIWFFGFEWVGHQLPLLGVLVLHHFRTRSTGKVQVVWVQIGLWERCLLHQLPIQSGLDKRQSPQLLEAFRDCHGKLWAMVV